MPGKVSLFEQVLYGGDGLASSQDEMAWEYEDLPNNEASILEHSYLAAVHAIEDAWNARGRGPPNSLRRKLGGVAPLHLFGSDFLDVMAQEPLVTKRVAHASRALTVELIFRRPNGCRARRDGARKDGVDVLDVR